MGALKWGLTATLCDLCTIVYNCTHVWPCGPLCEARELSLQNDDTCRQSWSIVDKYLKPSFAKDPAVLKILRVVNLLRVLFLVRRGDLLSRRVLCGHHFPGNYRHFCSQRRVRGVLNLGGVVKTLRRSNSLYLLSS